MLISMLIYIKNTIVHMYNLDKTKNNIQKPGTYLRALFRKINAIVCGKVCDLNTDNQLVNKHY